MSICRLDTEDGNGNIGRDQTERVTKPGMMTGFYLVSHWEDSDEF